MPSFDAKGEYYEYSLDGERLTRGTITFGAMLRHSKGEPRKVYYWRSPKSGAEPQWLQAGKVIDASEAPLNAQFDWM